MLLVVLGVGVFLIFLSRERESDLTLPAPTGPISVGRSVYDWVDEHATDPVGPPGARRELLVWMWYPAAITPSTAMDSYWPSSLPSPANPGGDGFFSRAFELISHNTARVHGDSYRDPAISSAEPLYPVVILRGGASAPVIDYSSLAEDLASYGYVVVGLDAPYRTSKVVFPDGRIISRAPENNLELVSGEALNHMALRLMSAWTADIAFALDRLQQWSAPRSRGNFAGHLDMDRIGVFGHSFGGAQAAQFCSQDSRCKAGIDIDGAVFGSVIQTGMHKPFFFLMEGQGDSASDAEVQQVVADIQSVYDRLPPETRMRLFIQGANHFTFSDANALLKSRILLRALQRVKVLRLDGRRQLAITAYCVRTFFEAHLKGTGGKPIQIRSPLYPEIQVQ